MESFIINSDNFFLKDNIQAYYSSEFYGYGNAKNPNYLNVLKNDNHHNWSQRQLLNATNELRKTLMIDLPEILRHLKLRNMTICVVPRSKKEDSYRNDQILFKKTVSSVINQLNTFSDGVNYIRRHINTKTTHLRRPIDGFINDGSNPYPGITLDTCNISNDVRGKDILLIDDIYTKTVNIDEDVIQALLDRNSKSVTFYAVARTVKQF